MPTQQQDEQELTAAYPAFRDELHQILSRYFQASQLFFGFGSDFSIRFYSGTTQWKQPDTVTNFQDTYGMKQRNPFISIEFNADLGLFGASTHFTQVQLRKSKHLRMCISFKKVAATW